MQFDTTALTSFADEMGVPLGEVTAVAAVALLEAYQRTPGAVANAVVTIDPTSDTLTINTAEGVDVTPPGFGRLATIAARQSMVTWVRDVQRRRAVGDWVHSEGRACTGTVRPGTPGRGGATLLDMGRGAIGVLPPGEAIAGEDLIPGHQVNVLVLNANVDDRGTVRLAVSRRQPLLVSELLTDRVAQLRDGDVHIVAVARDPGERTKISVRAENGDHSHAARVVSGELDVHLHVVSQLAGGDHIEVVAYDDDLATYVCNALAPAVGLIAQVAPGKKVTVSVVPAQVADASGRKQANVRLAQRLTGARIDLVASRQLAGGQRC